MANETVDMSLIKDSPHYVEKGDPQVDALRTYQLLSTFKENGKIKSIHNKNEKELILEFDALSDDQKEERLNNLKAIYSTPEI